MGWMPFLSPKHILHIIIIIIIIIMPHCSFTEQSGLLLQVMWQGLSVLPLGTTISPAKTAKLIEMSSGMETRVGPVY